MQKPKLDQLVLAAIISAGSMIAFQVGGKATRDALFLSNFPVTALPAILATSAAVSILAVFAATRLISAKGPGTVIPAAFGVSSVLLIVEWMAYGVAPRSTATVFYLHMAGFGAILVSGFWSIVSEMFDPRTAKARIGRIAAGSTLGGLIGGLVAERVGAVSSVSAMLPVLAIFHLLCALLNRRLKRPATLVAIHSPLARSDARTKSGLDVLRAEPYLTKLALLVMLGTIAETLLDYVLKAQALGTYSQSQQLLRFFAFFYTGVSLVTFLVQAVLTRYFLKQFGLTRTMSTMPLLVVGGGVGSLVWPGLFSTSLVRGGQAILRSSLFRSGYELLFSPVPPSEKRAAKAIVDVAFDKLGDAVGAGLIRLVLFAGMAALTNSRVLTLIAVFLGVLSLVLTSLLNRGYVATLERSLVNQAADLDLIDIEERTTRKTMLRTLGTVDLGALRSASPVVAKRPPEPAKEGIRVESSMKRLIDLQSQSVSVVRAALESRSPLDPVLIAPVIRLLARDDVSEDAVRALRNSVDATVGQLTDALLNVDEDFAIRRRIPRVLAHSLSARAVEGLLRGLADLRFEVRFSCGRGLSRVCGADPTLPLSADSVYGATLKEIATAKRISEAPRVIDSYEDPAEATSPDTAWKSTDFRLEHIFRLLSLKLPSEPLHIAFQALHTKDTYLRGTALEYLESILPSGIRENLLHFLEGSPQPSTNRRSADHLAQELLKSRRQIELRLSLARSAPLAKDS